MGWLDKTPNGQDSTLYQSDASLGNIAISAITQYGRCPLGFSVSLYYETLNHGYTDIDSDIATESIESYAYGLDLFALIDCYNFTFFGAVSYFLEAETSISTNVYDPQGALGLLLGVKYRLVNSFALLFQTSYQKMFDTTSSVNGVDTTFSGSVLRISFGIAFSIKMYFPSFS